MENLTQRSEKSLGKDQLPKGDDPDWVREGLYWNAFGAALKRKYGGRVQRVSLDAGMTCPNVDGAVAKGGCNFCDNRSFSPSRRARLARVQEQLHREIESVARRYKKVTGFIAYFQPATNTYADIEQLDELFRMTLSADPRIVGLAIGTRPDCVPNSVLDVLQTLATSHSVSIEFGMQSVLTTSLEWMNRAHTHADMINAVDRTRGRGLEIGAHVILGIPGETHENMMLAATSLSELGVDSVKIHNLYAVGGTPLGDSVLRGEITMMEREDYIQTVVDFIERLPPSMIVERISGDAPPEYLIAPKWCHAKSVLRLDIEREFERRGSRQGKHYNAPNLHPSDRPVPKDHTPEAILERIEGGRRLPILKLGGMDSSR